MNRPEPSEYTPEFANYVSLIQSDDIESVLRMQLEDMRSLIGSAVGEKETYRYAPEKWSVRQLVGHVADSERIFGWRALALARGETASLPGFDETVYMAHAPFEGIPLTELWAELDVLRQANILMVQKFRPEDWTRVGVANDNRATTRAIVYVLAGHAQHHMSVLKERYLNS